MAKSLSYSLDWKQFSALKRLFREFPKRAHKIEAQAVRDALRLGKKIVLQEITRAFNIKRKDLVTPHRWSRNRAPVNDRILSIGENKPIDGVIRVEGERRVPLLYFGAKQVKGRSRRVTFTVLKTHGTVTRMQSSGGGVNYAISKDRGRKRIRQAFIATMKSGHRGVYRRVGMKRFPIRELLGVSIGFAAEQTAGINRRLRAEVAPRLYDRINSKLALLMQKKAQSSGNG